MINPIPGKTFGLEIEVEKVLQEHVRYLSNEVCWKFTGDASVETPVSATITGATLFLEQKNLRNSYQSKRGMQRIGGELVSPILSYDDKMKKNLRYILNTLETKGEPNNTFRSGIHVHVSFKEIDKVLDLKNIIILASAFETLFFYLGGMGYTYRGIFNDSSYCRPITKFGPPVVDTSGGFVQIFTTESLLETNSIRDFWYRFGKIRNNATRYSQPARYCWINLCGLYPDFENAHNTLEFRIFNKSLNHEYVNAIIEFCLKFTEYLVNTNELIKMDEVSIFNGGKSDAYASLELARELFGFIDSDTMRILKQIVRLTPEISLDKMFVKTHKNVGRIWSAGDNMNWLTYIAPILIKNPKYIDRHFFE